jgi:hypothetical protein
MASQNSFKIALLSYIEYSLYFLSYLSTHCKSAVVEDDVCSFNIQNIKQNIYF